MAGLEYKSTTIIANGVGAAEIVPPKAALRIRGYRYDELVYDETVSNLSDSFQETYVSITSIDVSVVPDDGYATPAIRLRTSEKFYPADDSYCTDLRTVYDGHTVVGNGELPVYLVIDVSSPTPITYSLTLDDAGGTGGSGTIYEKFDTGWYSDSSCTSAISSVSVPSRENYEFLGYYDDPVEGSLVIDQSGSIESYSVAFTSVSSTLYAHWSQITHEIEVTCVGLADGTVNLLQDGESVGESVDGVMSGTFAQGPAYALMASPKRTADGGANAKKFVGWYSDSSCTELVSSSYTYSFSLDDSIELYAKFVDNDAYSIEPIQIDESGNAVSGNAISVSPEAPDIEASGGSPAKYYSGRYVTFYVATVSSWEFVGWKVVQHGEDQSGHVIAESDTTLAVRALEDVDVYAVFTRPSFSFDASFEDASSGASGVTLVRQLYDGSAWQNMSDDDEVRYGDSVRAVVDCGSTEYELGRSVAGDAAVPWAQSGTEYIVTLPPVVADVSLRLGLSGTVSVTLECPDDGDARVSIIGPDGVTVIDSTTDDNDTVSVRSVLGDTLYIATEKVSSSDTFGFDGWFDESDNPIVGYLPVTAVVMAGESLGFVAKYTTGDKTLYVKVRNSASFPGGGALFVSGGEAISAAEYASALDGFDTTGDPVGTKYVKLPNLGQIDVSVEVTQGFAFKNWIATPITPGSPVDKGEPVSISGEAISLYCNTHLEVEAEYKGGSLHWLTIIGAGDVDFAPRGLSSNVETDFVAEQFEEGDLVSVSVKAPYGKVFAGLFSDAARSVPYPGSVVAIGNSDIALYAKFVDSQDDFAIFAFGCGDGSMTAHWRSNLQVSAQPFSPAFARVEADGYDNVKLRVLMASSPDAPASDGFGEGAETIEFSSDSPRRVPRHRPERHCMVDIETDSQVTMVEIATSTGGLL